MKAAINYHGQRAQIARRYAFLLSRKVTPLIGVERDGYTYVLPTQDVFVGAETFVHGQFEIEKLALTLKLVEERTGQRLEGREFLDVGANIGTTSIPAVKRHRASRAWCFEPSPANLRLLRCNIMLNDLMEQVEVIPAALSDHSGAAALGLSPFGGSDHRVMTTDDQGSFGEEEWSRIPINVERFDDEATRRGIDIGRVGLAWIDAQGYEGWILRGATSLVTSDVPVLTEYWPYGLRRNACLEEFHDLVAEHYSVVVDIGERRPKEYKAADIVSLCATYPGVTFTDLLLLK